MLAEASGDAMQLRSGSDLQLLPRIERLTEAHLLQQQQQPASGGGGGGGGSGNSADLLQLLVSFSRVSFIPDETWLECHELCAVRLARQGQLAPAAVSAILQAYKRLRCYYPRLLVSVLRGMLAEMQEQRRRLRKGEVMELLERRRQEQQQRQLDPPESSHGEEGESDEAA